MEQKPNIHEYTSYRAYLQSHYEDSKKKNPSWSYEAWARKLGLKNNTSILKIIHGQREAGPAIAQKFSEYFKFDVDERVYFEDLIRLSKSKKDPRLAVALMYKMMKQYPQSKVRFLNDKEFSAISHWWFYVIRQMTKLKGFRNDAQWISRQLHFHVPPKEIKKAIEILQELKLLKIENSELKMTKERLNTSDDVASEAVKRFHEEMIENAKQAVRSVPVLERQISGVTLAVSEEDLPKAKHIIEEFEEKFSKLINSKNANTVYQLNTQFFPLLKKGVKENENN